MLISLIQIAITGLLGYFLGIALGMPFVGVAIALFGFLLWQVFSTHALIKTLKQKEITVQSALPLSYEAQQLHAAISTELSQLKEGSAEHQTLLDTLQASSEALPDGVIVINAENEVQWANKKATEFLGVRDPEDVGQRIESLIHHLHFGGFLSGDHQNADDEDVLDEESLEIQSPINERLHLRLSFSVLPDNFRAIAVQDVTAFHRVNQMRQNFIGNASHELRTPLTVIRGYLEAMIEDETITTDWQDPLQAMDKQASRMQNIIEGMLTLSNLESRSRLAGQDSVHLKTLIGQITADMQQAFQASHHVHAELPEDIYILGEENELYSVFGNLLKNAYAYSPKQSNIRIDWEQDNSQGRLIVTDEGSGIPTESIRRLTERFYRVDAGRSREQGGTGLGLAIVKHALMRHEAHLSIESELTKGSQFICHFPIRRISMITPDNEE